MDDIQFDDTDGAYLVAEPDATGDDLTAGGTSAGRSATSVTASGASFASPFGTSIDTSFDASFDASIDAPFGMRAKLAGAMPGPMSALASADSAGWAVLPALSQLLPDGLRRGSTVAVTSSVSLLLALLGAPSAAGAWVAMIGMPTIGVDAVSEAGVDLSRLAIINPAEGARWTGPAWTTAVGALLDAVDVVVARPGVTGSSVSGGVARQAGAVSDPDARRLTARARSKGAVLILFGQQAASWPSVQAQLSARHGQWSGIGDGHGRITARQLIVSATGRGLAARPQTAQLWLPADTSATAVSAPVVDIASDRETVALPQAG